MGTSDTRQTLRRLSTRPKKSLGQHFLTDRSVLDTIISAADLSHDDTVVEVGPGLGILTRELAARVGRVVAIELDDKLAASLAREMASSGNVRIVRGDVLEIDLAGLIELHPHPSPLPSRERERRGYKVVANLPYNIASPTIRRFLGLPRKPDVMVVMVQKEVARDIAAAPGEMGLLSVMVQFYARAELIADVPSTSFYPPPKVTSAILRLTPHSVPPLDVGDVPSFFDFVASGFRQPRKHLANSMSLGLSLPVQKTIELLGKAGIDHKRRPQALSIREWADLWQAYRSERLSPSPPAQTD